MQNKNNVVIELKKLTILIVCIIAYNSCKTNNAIIVNNVLQDKSNWVIFQQPGGVVSFKKNKIEIFDANGYTVWYKNLIEGNIKIVCDVTVLDASGSHDRVSDNNCFWMATDPNNPNDFLKN